ncbi:MAG: hypothetical protein ACTSP4_09840 [Candidatus Hodarchaeales archaeon]
MSIKPIIIREKSGNYLACYIRKGEVNWFRQEIKISQSNYTSPARTSYRKPIKPLFYWIMLLVTVIFIYTSSADMIAGIDPIIILYSYLINLITLSGLIIGMIAGYGVKIYDDPILSRNKSVELASKSWHIISIRNDIVEPMNVNGLYSIPASYVIGYRVRTRENKYPVERALDLVMKNRIIIDLSADYSIPDSSHDKLRKAMKNSLEALGMDLGRKIEEKKWTIYGIPEEIPVNRAMEVHKARDRDFQLDNHKKRKEVILPLDHRLLLQCSSCKKEYVPRELILRPPKERSDPLICFNCLKKQLKSRYEESKQTLNTIEGFIFRLKNIRNSIKLMREALSGEEEKIPVKMFLLTIILGSIIFLMFILIFFVLMQIFTLFLAEILIFASVTWLGYLLIDKPYNRDLKKIITLDCGLSKKSQEFLEKEFNLEMTLNSVKKETWIGILVISFVLAILESTFIVWARYPFFQAMLVEITTTQTMILILYYSIPSIIILTGFTLSIMTLILENFQLYHFNYYVPSRINFDDQEYYKNW